MSSCVVRAFYLAWGYLDAYKTSVSLSLQSYLTYF